MSLLHHHSLIKGSVVAPTWQFDESQLTFYNGTTYSVGSDWVLGGNGAFYTNNGITNFIVKGVKFISNSNNSGVGLDADAINKEVNTSADFLFRVPASSGSMRVRENGVTKGDFGSHTGGNIQDVEGVIKYFDQNDLLTYTSFNYGAALYGYFSPRNLNLKVNNPEYLV